MVGLALPAGLGRKAKLATVACHPDGRVHAVIVGTDIQVWHGEQNGSMVNAA